MMVQYKKEKKEDIILKIFNCYKKKCLFENFQFIPNIGRKISD